MTSKIEVRTIIDSEYKNHKKRISKWNAFVSTGREYKDYKSEKMYIRGIYMSNQKLIDNEYTNYDAFKKHLYDMAAEKKITIEEAVKKLGRQTLFVSEEERGLQNIFNYMTPDMREKLENYGITDSSGFSWNGTAYEYCELVNTPDGPKTLTLEFKEKYDSATEDMVKIVMM